MYLSYFRHDSIAYRSEDPEFIGDRYEIVVGISDDISPNGICEIVVEGHERIDGDASIFQDIFHNEHPHVEVSLRERRKNDWFLLLQIHCRMGKLFWHSITSLV